MKKINVGIIGMGFIGVSHIEAVRRIGYLNLAAVADSDSDLAKRKADEYNIPLCYDTADALLADESIDVVHNCTPNHLHLEINSKAIEAGKHVFSEKPLARSIEESKKMMDLLAKYPDIVCGINFCYRMNPLIQDAKNRINAGEIGKPYLIHGSYLQDWLLFDTDYNWRIEKEISGDSRCIADIGTHWMDLAQVMAGSKIIEVCANVVTAIPTRKKPSKPVESFAVNTDVECTEVIVDTEDYAGALLKFENGASGVFQCSQISAGRKCFIDIEVDGSLASYHWQHQQSDRMWKGNRNTNNEEVMRNPNLMTPDSRKYTYLSAGHSEGWNDAFKNTLSAYYEFVLSGKNTKTDNPDFATFEDGHYLMRLTAAIMKSGKERRWVSVEEI